MELKKIQSALVSVYNKDGLAPIIEALHKNGVTLYSTGGTESFIKSLGIPVVAVENLTDYPSILDGRVKTLHPKIFGGILAKREYDHRVQLDRFDIPELDCVIVDLYPFEETLASTNDEKLIIEKIDIGGISLIRAAAKNFNDVVVVPSKNEYATFLEMITEKNGATTLENRKFLAGRAFTVSAHYDTAIGNYFKMGLEKDTFQISQPNAQILRYGENPHQNAIFYGDLDKIFKNLGGKAISFNNLVDIDAAIALMAEFKNDDPTFAIIKHTNACGVATRSTILEAWKTALSSDPISAFGGILICNTTIDKATAEEINAIFYEVLMAPSFTDEALEVLLSKSKRTVLQVNDFGQSKKSFKNILHGIVEQDADLLQVDVSKLNFVTNEKPTEPQIEDLIFANKCVKHLKSNAIAIVKNNQLIGMGCGQTSRVDALTHAIAKAKSHNLSLENSVLSSDAFFPFADCVEIAHNVGIKSIIQPGGSVKDNLSIDFCNDNNMSMVFTGVRHFRH